MPAVVPDPDNDIAEFLLAHGARPTIFSAAMQGQLAVVRAFVEALPGVQRTLGPHGLTLMAHARAGGPDALPVLRFLESLGDADRRIPSVALAPAVREQLVGIYGFVEGERDHFVVDVRSDQLGLQRPGTNRRFLISRTTGAGKKCFRSSLILSVIARTVAFYGDDCQDPPVFLHHEDFINPFPHSFLSL